MFLWEFGGDGGLGKTFKMKTILFPLLSSDRYMSAHMIRL